MKDSKVFLSLGSNLGDRKKNLLRCIEYLRSISKIKKISSIYETKPFKVEIKQDDFLNLVVEIVYKNSPYDLLENISIIEKKLGRVRSEKKNEPREIDIDIIFFDDLVLDEKKLILPHPRFSERLFVLDPLNEIASEFKDPLTKKRIKDLLIDAQNSSN
ncbi:MAG: 2-amino-4-hydroxy-6-hydroxymethyldihydropteridine diphosphokinase [Chloroflexi bacterium]|nr:2-amino-4-hydroxy-6-hydroxymethyldihydropteridine diphosphokinase [Chloroflexota bacterium]MBK90074.1 2-amino-4-hydroxy-6-hydroxymethyldihydropteridine diphosphokinase [Chloroflexota bacterium]|tara:strand:+ start:4865 stop:5341 length:477 start_codon:yes stop_codon:yes gene_type:complete